MKVLTSFLSSLTNRRPALIFGCAAIGLTSGLIGGMIHYSRQTPVYESHALLYPADSYPELQPKEWMEKEAAAMLQQESLEAVAHKLRMETTHKRNAAECAALLRDSVSISIETRDGRAPHSGDPATDPSTFPVLRVAVRGGDAAECAEAAQAFLNVREDAWLKLELQRMDNDPRTRAAEAKSIEIGELFRRMDGLRKELIAGLPAAGIQDPDIRNPDISSTKLASLQLTGPLKKVQDEWLQVREAANRYSSSGVSRPLLHADPYAEVLEKPAAPVDPISPVWNTYGRPWMTAGLGAGLLAGLIFSRLRAWTEVEDTGTAPKLPPTPAVEY